MSTFIKRCGCKKLVLLFFSVLSLQIGFFEPHARADAKDEYKRVIGEAVHEYDSEHWPRAIELFQKAYELKPNARALRGMGLAAYEDQRYVDAIKWLSQALEHPVQPLSATLRAEIKPVLARAREFVGYYKLNKEPENIGLEIDGQIASIEDGKLAVNVGERVLVAKAKGFEPLKQNLTVKPGDNGILGIKLEPVQTATTAEPKDIATEKKPIKATDTPKRHRSANQTLAWTLVGTGAAMAIGGGVLFGIAMKNKADVESATTWNGDSDQRAFDNVPVFFGTGAALAGVGLVGLSVGLVMILSSGESADKTVATKNKTKSGLQVHVGLTGLSMSGAF